MAGAEFVRSFIDRFDWFGIVLVMALEGTGVPFPGQIVMPLAGWLLGAEGGLGWPGVLAVALCGATGCTLGASLGYALGANRRRSLVARPIRWARVTPVDLERAGDWFARRGGMTIILGRLLPLGPPLISVAAGVAGMDVIHFLRATFLGSFLSCATLAAAGYLFGPAWEQVWSRARWVILPIAAVVLGVVAWRVLCRLHGDDRGSEARPTANERTAPAPMGVVRETSNAYRQGREQGNNKE